MNVSLKVASAQPAPRKLNRAEKAEATRARLFNAAIELVGEVGYADASVARITERAAVAQGTFYNYFESRQDLLDQLLPAISDELLDYVKARVLEASDSALDRERARMAAFFDFLADNPQLFKILSQGPVHSPKGFALHLAQSTASFRRAMAYEQRNGNLKPENPDDIEIVIQILMGSREYLSARYCFVDGEVVAPPPHVLDAYVRFAASTMFKDGGGQ